MEYWWVGIAPFNLDNILGPYTSEGRAQLMADKIGGPCEVEPFPTKIGREAVIMFKARFTTKRGME